MALHLNSTERRTDAHAHEDAPFADMVWIPRGTFRMGSDKHYPEEAPVHRVTVDSFWIDCTPVTNRKFRNFINATSYVTIGEIKPDAKDYPGALPHMLKAGWSGLLSTQARGRSARLESMVELRVWRQLAQTIWAAFLDQRA